MQAGNRPYAAIVILGTLATVLAILLSYELLERSDSQRRGVGLRDDERLAAEVEAMVAATANTNVWDTHPDADVGRVMLPGIEDRVIKGRTVSSNLQGMREGAVVMPKPEGTIRTVMLGDSFVYGLGVEAQERLGNHLQRYLSQRAQTETEHIEVLHYGLSSWNIVSECEFLRRQLSLLQPDLVVHISVRNDLADTMGARGFGGMSTFSPRHPSYADGAIRVGFTRWSLHKQAYSLLPMGLDHESKVRYEEAAAAVARLAQDVADFGGEYLHVFHWGLLNVVSARRIATRLAPRQQLYLPEAFVFEPNWRMSDVDEHWNPTGHKEVARLLYGIIVQRNLLPDLNLGEWPEVEEWASKMALEGHRAAQDTASLPAPTGLPVFDIGQVTRMTASQVHTGIAADGTLSPYVSLLLRNERANLLTVEGTCLDRLELNGGKIAVSLDGIAVGSIELMAARAVTLTLDVPEKLRDQPCLTVRFIADDFVYTGDNLRRCISFQLESVKLH